MISDCPSISRPYNSTKRYVRIFPTILTVNYRKTCKLELRKLCRFIRFRWNVAKMLLPCLGRFDLPSF